MSLGLKWIKKPGKVSENPTINKHCFFTVQLNVIKLQKQPWKFILFIGFKLPFSFLSFQVLPISAEQTQNRIFILFTFNLDCI